MRARLPSFWIKAVLAVAVVAAADVLLFDVDGLGLNLGLFSLALVAAVGLTNSAIRRHRLAMLALAAAALLAALQIERATFIGWLLFAVAMAVAALAPRAPQGQDGWRWFQRLIAGGLKALVGPPLDVRDVLKVRARHGPIRLTLMIAGAVLPVVGGVVFVSLFAAANPVIDEAFGAIRLPELQIARLVFWIMVTLIVWAVLRPRGLRRTLKTPGLDGDLNVPGVTTGSIVASLVVFNLIFAVQNGLDIAFLWSGAGLPKGVSFSEYAHRGAEPLIATALLAGLFVLVFLRPSSATADSRPVRMLVTVWVAQNLFLVASTALRTIDYIEAYSLTRMRIAALLWIALVATGLILVTWRLLRGKSSGWLINANLIAAGVVLVVCSVVDLGAITAAWNVRHARDVGGQGVELDVCYLETLGGAALVPLAEAERRSLPPMTAAKVTAARQLILGDTLRKQGAWRGWRFRDARRIDRMRELLGGDGRPMPFAMTAGDFYKYCAAGFPSEMPPVDPPPAAPLTRSPKPGT
ncbi:DUF4173 domain-containing protein [Phenylobacterium sp.]|uniref:DUF4153 domain-containing protein n=1 Tax=Phenylobacterium sp. TaxID=1871053 RepID=UPI002EDA9C35